MPTVSLETATLLVKIAFLVGAVTDGLAIIPMLSRRAGVAIFGGDASKDSAAYRYAMGIGAALMAGWTVLLLWGAALDTSRPRERFLHRGLCAFSSLCALIVDRRPIVSIVIGRRQNLTPHRRSYPSEI